MRPIKFRGQDKKTGEWTYGGITQHAKLKRTLIFDYDSQTIIPVSPFTVGEFTGLVDRKGQEIYEGDIMEDNAGISCIVWDEGAFWFKSPGSEALDSISGYDCEQAKVIGNIHDNPELIN